MSNKLWIKSNQEWKSLNNNTNLDGGNGFDENQINSLIDNRLLDIKTIPSTNNTLAGQALTLDKDRNPTWTTIRPGNNNLFVGQLIDVSDSISIEGCVLADGSIIHREKAQEIFEYITPLSDVPQIKEFLIHDLYKPLGQSIDDTIITDMIKEGSGNTSYCEYIVNNKIKFKQIGLGYGGSDIGTRYIHRIFVGDNNNYQPDNQNHYWYPYSGTSVLGEFEFLNDEDKFNIYSIRINTGVYNSGYNLTSFTFKGWNEITESWDTLISTGTLTYHQWYSYTMPNPESTLYSKFSISATSRSSYGPAICDIRIYGIRQDNSLDNYRILPNITNSNGRKAGIIVNSKHLGVSEDRVREIVRNILGK